MTTFRICCVSALVFGVSAENLAQAQTIFPFRATTRPAFCSRTMIDTDAAGSMEFDGQNFWQCEQRQVDLLWDEYHLVEEEWDNGGGLHGGVCDLNSALVG